MLLLYFKTNAWKVVLVWEYDKTNDLMTAGFFKMNLFKLQIRN